MSMQLQQIDSKANQALLLALALIIIPTNNGASLIA